MSQTNQSDNKHDTKIFVGNLTWRTTSDDLRTHFQQFGEVIDANVVCETYPGRSKGYGFVTFRDSVSAVRAVENPNPVIDGRTTNCNLAIHGGAKKNMNLPNQNGSPNQVRPAPHQYVPPHSPPPIWDPSTGQYLYYMYHNPCYNLYPTPTHMIRCPYGLPFMMQPNFHQANIRPAVISAPQRSSFRLDDEIINDTDQEAAPQSSSSRTERVSQTDQELIADVAHHDNEEAVTKPDSDVDQQTATDQEGGNIGEDGDIKQDEGDSIKQDVHEEIKNPEVNQQVEIMCEQKHGTKQDEDVTIELDNGIEVTHQDERVLEDDVEDTP